MEPPEVPARQIHPFDFDINGRIYHVTRDDRRGAGYAIVSNGVLIHFVSSVYYGEIGAFLRIARVLYEIESTSLGVLPPHPSV